MFPRIQDIQAYATGPQQDNPSWTEIYGFHFAIAKGPEGDDVWFNALPSYVATQPLYQIAATAATPNFNANTKSIYYCPTAIGQGYDAPGYRRRL